MYRTLNLLQQLSGKEWIFFNTIKSIMHARWNVVLPLFNKQNKYTLLSVYGQFYLWITVNDTSINLSEVTLEYGLSCNPNFGQSTLNYCRMGMVQSTPVWNLFVPRLQAFLGLAENKYHR